MFHDLKWLGIEWQKPAMRQSEHFDVYQKALEQLKQQGLIYPAFLSRGEIKKHASATHNWPQDPDGAPLYPGLEKYWSQSKRTQTIAHAIENNAPFAWRLDMEKALSLFPMPGAEDWGDVVLARKDTPTSYHLAVVLDDAAQNISHIVRGLDLEAATPVHILLQRLLNLPTPAYFHHRLITDDKGDKLSKSNKATGLKHLRDEGASLEDILKLISWNNTEVEELLSQFT